MFYNYGLSADSAGSASYSKVLGTVSTESALGTPRKGGNVKAVGATSGQNVGYPLSGSSSSVDPFSGVFTPVFGSGVSAGGSQPWAMQFSQLFGGGSVGALSGNYILLTVGKVLAGLDGEHTALTLLKTTSHFPVLGASDAQVAAGLQSRTAASRPSIGSAQAVSMIFPRLYHAVTAAKSAGAYGVSRGVGVLRQVSTTAPGQGNSAAMRSAVTYIRAFASTSAQLLLLLKAAGKVLAGVAARESVSVTHPGKAVMTVSAEVVARLIGTGKVLSSPSGEALAVTIRRPLHNNALSAQTTHVTFGNNVFYRAFLLVSGEAIGLLRGLAVSHGAATSESSSASRSSGLVRGAIGGSAAGLLKIAGRRLGALSSGAYFLVRTVGLLRSGADTAQQSLTFFAARYRSTGATQGQQPALSRQYVKLRSFGAASAQLVTAVTLPTVSHFLSWGVAAGQTVASVRGVSHSLATASAAVQGAVRGISHRLAAVSASVARLSNGGTHFVGAAVVSFSIAAERISHLLVRGSGSAQSVATLISGRVVRLSFGAVNTASAAVRRLVLKLIGVASAQSLISGHSNYKIIRVATTNVAAVFTPKGLIVGAVNAQVARLVDWFHLFVPDWAYQQTTLLPPAGGPAEPPAFGPIDPADQTTFAFDWSKRAAFNDPIVSATVVSIPAGMTFLGPVFTGGTLVEVTALPFSPPQLPATYSLRCTCTFASGRRSSFSIPVPIRTL